MKKTAFYLDEFEKSFDGFTDGQTWNGFACPLFTFEVAMMVMAENNRICGVYGCDDSTQLVYDDRIDAFCNSDLTDVYKAQSITFNDEEIKVYPVGAFGWCWDEEEITFKEGDKVKFYPEYADGDNGIFVCDEDSDGDRVKVIFPDSTLNFWKTEIVKTEMIYKV
jgi:hypothetical protein